MITRGMIVESTLTRLVKVIRAHHEMNVIAFFEVRQWYPPEKERRVLARTSLPSEGKFILPSWIEIA